MDSQSCESIDQIIIFSPIFSPKAISKFTSQINFSMMFAQLTYTDKNSRALSSPIGVPAIQYKQS